ncbi:hypothetical protein [Methanimicrococcus hacksteinii]|uniref:hypothetical protein n=1 Tax=Methanimicrococcus hacksteinii TaxID=3028293 RepID=UPI00298ED9FB|nr:hypothetical protein [Methanimicrococcus sp. At1]
MHHLILITSARYASVGTDYLTVSVCTATLLFPFAAATLLFAFAQITLPIPSIQLPICRPVSCRRRFAARERHNF